MYSFRFFSGRFTRGFSIKILFAFLSCKMNRISHSTTTQLTHLHIFPCMNTNNRLGITHLETLMMDLIQYCEFRVCGEYIYFNYLCINFSKKTLFSKVTQLIEVWTVTQHCIYSACFHIFPVVISIGEL